MKVLHFGFGGQMVVLCEGLREINVNATSCHMKVSSQRFKPDICFEQKKHSEAEQRRFLMDAMRDYDIFHFHFGRTILKDHKDLQILKKMGKKIVVQHRGSEVRRLSIAKKNNPYVRVKKEFSNERKRISLLKSLSSSIDHAIVADHELLPYISDFYKNIHIVPQAIHTDKLLPFYPNQENDEPLIVHSPTHFKVKGTEYVKKAVKQLKDEGLRFKFKLINKIPNSEAVKIYQKADIIIDQLLIGSYGVFSLEAMALGKPVICYIRDDLLSKYPPDLPVENANPKTIYSTLKSLIINPEKRYQIGIRGREYVEKYHDSKIVASQLKKVYEML